MEEHKPSAAAAAADGSVHGRRDPAGAGAGSRSANRGGEAGTSNSGGGGGSSSGDEGDGNGSSSGSGGSSSGGYSSDGSSDDAAGKVDRAIRKAKARSSAHHRASMPSLLARFGITGDLDDLSEKRPHLTAEQMRAAVAADRAREAVKELLVQRRLLDPSMVSSRAHGHNGGIGAGAGAGRGANPGSNPGGGGARHSSPGVLSQSSSSTGRSGPGLGSPMRDGRLTSDPPPPPGSSGQGGSGGGSPTSPMAAAAVRRRNRMLERASGRGPGHVGHGGHTSPRGPVPCGNSSRLRVSVTGALPGGAGHQGEQHQGRSLEEMMSGSSDLEEVRGAGSAGGVGRAWPGL